ncbi:unnamed protein product [Arctogadus glacialis]
MRLIWTRGRDEQVPSIAFQRRSFAGLSRVGAATLMALSLQVGGGAGARTVLWTSNSGTALGVRPGRGA